ncbi:MAG: UDP-N-acetylglucosamine 4,6-dehydratase (inverting) [Gammaproteobacteria bacterium 39-13]|nr:UDP-N-acetylglucosamine 4,6-dehydratase (inverting) [Gammaproteobacteria bacterium]OJV87873.1 MAG: UDP-N-acetylglucosamine 4,6-dehydratase (inverting) [Gammaproteobacteria bacterium 39-13]
MLNNKSILITGGTGTLGRGLVATLLKNYKVKKLVIFSRDELKQFEMQREFNSPEMRYFLGDVRDVERLKQAMRGIDFVIHAAALKQIPAAEYNPIECIKTNIHGAENVVQAALFNDVEKVVALSTDKAANPVNLYGATKLASDKLFVAANNIAGGHRTRFSVVRYGNVVNSRGSVIPFFQKLIADGKKELPVTDKRMTRFLITLEQGIQFILDSFARMQGGEIFVPKIPSANIMNIVEAVAPPTGISVHEIGIRPGEKLHEVMCPKDDSHLTIAFPDHFVIRPAIKFTFDIDYTVNQLGQKGQPVPEGFTYDSETNSEFLSFQEIQELMRS